MATPLARPTHTEPYRIVTAVPNADTPASPELAAEAYSALGWRVVPIGPGRKYPEGLGRWQDHATDDLDTIRNWYTGLYRGHGVGIATGQGSDIWVLDIDIAAGKLGAQALTELNARYGQLPATVTTITGSGGLHLFFQWDPDRPVTNGSATALKTHLFDLFPHLYPWVEDGDGVLQPPKSSGLDVRGEGGQVVAAPTPHPDTGQAYTWVTGKDPWTHPVADAPDWLYNLMTIEAPVETTAPGPTSPGAVVSTDDSIAEWVNEQTNWPTLLTEAGWTLHSNHGEDTWWTRPGKDRRQGHSAVLHGTDGPLVVFTSEIPAALATAGRPTVDGSGISFSRFGWYAGTVHGGDRSQAAKEARLERRRIEGTHGPIPDLTAPTSAALAPAPVEQPPAPIRLLTVTDILALQPPPPFIGDWLDLGMLATMPGKYGSLKSFAAMSMCLSVATGTPWLGQAIHTTGPAIYCSLEGSYTLKPRVAGWLEHNTRDAADGFWVLDQRINLLDPGSVEQFLTLLDDVRPLLVVIDTLSKATPGAEENSKPDVSRAYTALDEMRRTTSGSVLTVHHTGHSASGRGRGFSGFEDDLDVVLALEGQWKEGPVRLVSQKQKARENPHPIWLSLTTSNTGHPVVIPTVDPNDTHAAEGMDDLIDEAIELVTTSPGQSKSKIVDAMSAAARWRKLKAIDQAVEAGLLRFEYGQKNSQKLYPNA